jgi:3-hydroxyisobutyrate dehydrogenase-like beta-hydroxyacid dehydrogenase
MTTTIAFLGLGAMGSRMAANLQSAGYALRVYNRDRAKAQALANKGVQACDTPAAAVQGASFVVSMVADDVATRAVMLGPDGAVGAATAGTILIDSSTNTPAMAREVAQAAAARRVQYLDAPVSGSLAQAQAKELVFMVGGDPVAFERAQPVLQAMGRMAKHMGAAGAGATIKLINNMLSGAATAATAEAVMIAEAAGLDRAATLEVLGIGVVDGRTFTDADRAGSELVAVINETTARTYWPGENPVGQCVRIGADSMPCTTVVGIVTNARRQQLVEQPVSQVYRPLDQVPAVESDRPVSFFGYSMVARTSRDPRSVAEPLRRMLQASAPNVPYAHVRPLAERLGRQTRSWNLGATMFSIFGVLSLVLAAIGLYSVVAFTVAQRMHEFGVRVALGASGRSLLRLTVLRGVAPAAAGILVGLGFALAASRLMEGLLFELSPRDPVVFGSVSVVLLVSAIAASLLPALRATRVDPMMALRTD